MITLTNDVAARCPVLAPVTETVDTLSHDVAGAIVPVITLTNDVAAAVPGARAGDRDCRYAEP